MRLREAGFHDVSAAFVASTISGARRRPPGVSTSPCRTRSAGVRSCTATPAARARRLNERTSSPGCNVAPSRKYTAPRNTGERTRSESASRVSRTASSGRPTSSAAATERSTEPSCAGAAETSSRPPSRSHTSSPSARTAGTMRSPARQSRSAPSTPSTGSTDESADQ